MAVGAVLWVIGCVSLDQMAPPIDQTMADYGQKRGISAGSLSAGRQVYLNRCAGCHSIEPIGRYSLEQWEVIVPEMAPEAKLDSAQTDHLLRYIRTARQMIALSQAAAGREGGR